VPPACRGRAAVAELSVAELAAVNLKVVQYALESAARNGGAPPVASVRYLLARLALAAPGVAVRCPNVLAALDAVTLATVFALAGATPATPPAAPPPGPPESVLSTAQTAAMLGVSPQAVRRAAGRGTLAGTKSRVTGEWTFAPADVREYQHGNRR
jgi:Helix-turn-helix domain